MNAVAKLENVRTGKNVLTEDGGTQREAVVESHCASGHTEVTALR